MAVTKRTRYEVLTRDNRTCRYCRATDAPLTIDHVVPTALGGSDKPDNLVTACRDCNAGKSSSSPDAATVAQVSDDAARWALAMKSAADRLAANKAETEAHLKPWFDEWFIRSGPGWSYKLPNDAADVLTKYLAAGMPVEVLVDAARIALKKRDCEGYFRYFQGVANNMLAELQADAQAIMVADESPAPTQCPSCRYIHDADDCGFWHGWRVGLSDCSVMHTDTTAANNGHPDHYLMMALSRVVDAPAHEWAATWPFPSELYPIYTGRRYH